MNQDKSTAKHPGLSMTHARSGRTVKFATDVHPGHDRSVTPAPFSGRGSEDTLTPSLLNKQSVDPMPIGNWRCCKCKKGHAVFAVTTTEHVSHPIRALGCVCMHRSCCSCTFFDGKIKNFASMNNPEVVQLPEDRHKLVGFGVVCDCCGMSWRAEHISQGPSKSAMQRISAIPKFFRRVGLNPLPKLRPSRSLNNLKSASVTSLASPSVFHHDTGASRSVLNLRALSNEMEKGHGKQAEFATVKFTDILCTCGNSTAVTSLCFQIVDPPKDVAVPKAPEPSKEKPKEKPREKPKGPVFTSTPEDLARGHGTAFITLKGRKHPNPLMSNPV